MSIKNRPRQSLSRKKERAKPRELCLLVCEGIKDEPCYFDALKRELGLTNHELKIVKVGKDPATVVNKAIAETKNASISPIRDQYDRVWCIVDVERPQHGSLGSALALARANDIDMILTNPCFEYWLILHFKGYSRAFDSSQSAKKTLKKFLPNPSRDLDKLIVDRQEAIDNAIAVGARIGWTADIAKHNPSTAVHELVIALQEIADQPRAF